MIGVVVGWMASSPVWACGGFFCQAIPVEQAAERVVFAVDETSGSTEMHVQVSYQGSAPEFAWIVPVSSVPELFVSSPSLFQALGTATRPTFNAGYEEDGHCAQPLIIATSLESAVDAVANVTVVDEAQVGPYEAVTLQADSADALLDWLQDNQYRLPDALSPVLSPYVAENQYFVALRLRNGFDVGALQPLGLRYAGTTPAIPIQLTSVAATPDMRLEVYVFGDKRFVPQNYLHVEINEALIDWSAGGSNYADVITRAADDAGGQAFATDYAGPSSIIDEFLQVSPPDLSRLSSREDASDYLGELRATGALFTPDVLALFEAYIPMPPSAAEAGLTPAVFYAQLADGDASWDAEIGDIDAAGLTDALAVALSFAGDAAALAGRYSYLTRLTSSLSPLEMTVDPQFVANADMPDVSNVHSATLRLECEGRLRENTDRTYILSNGTRVVLPPVRAMDGLTDAEYLASIDAGAAALRVEATSAVGLPTLVQDNLADIRSALDAHNAGLGCGCDTSSTGGAPALVLAAGAFARRRRRG